MTKETMLSPPNIDVIFNVHTSSSSSSSRLAFVYQWHANIRVVVFHTVHRGQRDIRLCPLISYRLLCCNLTFAPPRESSSTSLSHSSPPSPSAVDAAVSCTPARSIHTCSHQRIHTHSSGALSGPSHRSNSDRLAMYCVTVFYRQLIYYSILKNPASLLAATAKVYLHLSFSVLHGRRPTSCLTTWA